MSYYGSKPGTTISIPVPVPSGGTGKTTFIPYSVVTGGTTTTGALQSVATVGTSGQILTSNGAGALPTWQTATGGYSSAILYLAGTVSNATGGAHNYTILYDTTVNLTSDITYNAGTGTLTFANAGYYLINNAIWANPVTVSNTTCQSFFVTNAGTIISYSANNPGIIADANQTLSLLFSAALFISAGGTLRTQVQINGGTQNIAIGGNGGNATNISVTRIA